MRIQLEGPYAELYEYGYLAVSYTGRKRVDLCNFARSDATATSYARYLLSIKLGRLLTDDEEADHINGDPLDDDISNLQVLSIEEHREKTRLERTRRPEQEKIAWPENEVLLTMLHRSNFSQVGRLLGVSDNAVRKRLKREGLI